MRTDSLDRFGTRIEKRFPREEILAMMEQAGLERVQFSPSAPIGARRISFHYGRDTEAQS